MDVDIEHRAANDPDSAGITPADGAKFLDTRNGDIYLADGDSWTQQWSLGSSGGGGFATYEDVTDHGAVGDGSTDDIDAFNDATAAVVANGGGTVFIPAGDYALSQTWEITDDRISITGDGSHPTLLPTSERITPLLSHTGNDYVVEGLTLDGQDSVPTGVNLVGVDKIVRGCHIENIHWVEAGDGEIHTPIGIDDEGGHSVITQNRVENIIGMEDQPSSGEYSGSARAILSATGGSDHAGDVRITNNTIRNVRYVADADGVVVGVHYSDNVIIANNYFENVHKSDIKVQGDHVRNVLISGNISVFDNALMPDSETYAKWGFIRIQAPEATITANRCRIDRGVQGSFLRAKASEVSYHNNTCILGSYDTRHEDMEDGVNDDGTFDGIAFYGDDASTRVFHVSATGNKIFGPVRFGVYLFEFAQNVMVANNMFRGTDSHCIMCDDASVGWVSIVDNIIKDSDNNAIRLKTDSGPFLIDGNMATSQNGLIGADTGVTYEEGVNYSETV